MKATSTLTAGRSWCFNILALFILFFSPKVFAQQPTSILTENWVNSAWTSFSLTLNTYDSNGYLITSISQVWNGSAWENNTRLNYNNNPTGSVNQLVAQTWIEGSSTWENSYRTTNTYSSSGKILSSTSDNWTAALSVWTPTIRMLFAYDASGYLINEQLQIWDFIASGWNNYLQTNYTNDASGMVVQEVQQIWTGTVYEDSNRMTYTYNASNQIIFVLREVWNGSAWINSAYDAYDYDAAGRLIHSISQEWNVATSSWSNTNQENYINNANGTISQIVSQEWLNGAWENSYRVTYTYAALSVATFERSGLIVYPNPARDIVRIKTTNPLVDLNFSIVDQTGKSFANGALSPEDMTIDVNYLASGIYFIQIGNLPPIKIIKQ